jgi:hypothetical protein
MNGWTHPSEEPHGQLLGCCSQVIWVPNEEGNLFLEVSRVCASGDTGKGPLGLVAANQQTTWLLKCSRKPGSGDKKCGKKARGWRSGGCQPPLYCSLGMPRPLRLAGSTTSFLWRIGRGDPLWRPWSRGCPRSLTLVLSEMAKTWDCCPS